MDVRQNRTIDKVIILGCGESILDLSNEEIDYINRCKTVIALNKFIAFYKKSNLLPTHVYFTDDHGNSLLFLQYIFDLCQKDNLHKLTFILNQSIKSNVFQSKTALRITKAKDYLRLCFWRHFLPPQKLLGLTNKKYFLCSNKNFYSFVTIKTWKEDMPWAQSLNVPLFHYRGSLTSTLNYCGIKYPKKEIYLIGNDFYGSNYFFEKELHNLNFDYTDWTTPLTKKEGIHFSFQNYQGTKMSDKFHIVTQNLSKSGNELFCTNPKSLLVKEKLVSFKPLLSH